MRLKAIVQAGKRVTDAGAWKQGPMPKSAFPLGKGGNFKVPSAYRWRVVRFVCLGEHFRLLIFYRLDLSKYSTYLGREEGAEMTMQARYEWHAGEGWHVHCCDGCDDVVQVPGVTGLRNRVPKIREGTRRVAFGITSDESALDVAARAFRIEPPTDSFELTMQ